ncbi:hypothetical protein BRX37_15915 [Sphingomonas sp. S-NIH.Pt3_0716]|jgi:hypothetical protein|nr:hypothetical protein BRX37_15915 [Sphingomonas sp. S-NIH.Pt3_0716]
MTKKLFDGAHQSKIDVDSAAKVIGYSGSSGGAAASALGALRQYGLVDGLRGDMAVSDLAMRILQPMDASELSAAIREAAMKPDIFERIIAQFGGRLPGSDEPIRSFLIRQEGFSTSGADELIDTLRSTLSMTAQTIDTSAQTATAEPETEQGAPPADNTRRNQLQPSEFPERGELITLPLGLFCKAELRLIGEVTDASYARLIKHLELLREIAAEEGSQ